MTLIKWQCVNHNGFEVAHIYAHNSEEAVRGCVTMVLNEKELEESGRIDHAHISAATCKHCKEMTEERLKIAH